MKLNIFAEEPVELPKELRNKWTKQLLDVNVSADKSTIIFICEILEILNGEKAKFKCSGKVDYDMFGGCDFTWTISSGKFQVTRQLEREISDGWQRLEVNTDKVLLWGLEKYKFSWNGECGNCLSTMVIQMETKNRVEFERIIDLGKKLFHVFKIC